MTHTDIAIVGGGLTGLAAALALGRAGRTVTLVAPRARPDQRTSALMLPVCAFLRDLDVFEDPAELGAALTAIRLIDATSRLIRAPETLFEAKSEGLPAFSYNFPNAALSEKLNSGLKKLDNVITAEATADAFRRNKDGTWQVQLSDGQEIEVRLLVGADGKRSPVRSAIGVQAHEHRFSQSALVADLEMDRDLHRESVEFHYPNGPFTLVPAQDKVVNLVWVDLDATLRDAAERDESAFCAELIRKSQGLFGRIRLKSRRFVFPLSTLRVEQAGAQSAVLIGEAAHAFPPIGAQGLNLGLRDVEDLALAVSEVPETAGWAEEVSRRYAEMRGRDISMTTAFVDGLFRSLLSDLLPAQALRAGGIWALKTVSPLRRQAFDTGMGARSTAQSSR